MAIFFEKKVSSRHLSHLDLLIHCNNIKLPLDPDATGRQGGIDIYCEKPYPIVGECKASKHDGFPMMFPHS
jgi:hypothetical protein